MARIDPISVTRWITAAAVQHADTLPAHLMQRLQISRRQAGLLLKRLVALQWLQASGTPRKPRYTPGPLRQVVKRYALAGLQEDAPWRQDFAPCFALPPALQAMAQHAFTELVNNAVDHSGGSSVTVSMRQTPLQLQLLVSDDGVGLFRRVAEHFDVAEPALAMLELAKGKLTSDPDRHCGHGLVFTAQLADVFDLHANAAAFQRRGWDGGRWHALLAIGFLVAAALGQQRCVGRAAQGLVPATQHAFTHVVLEGQGAHRQLFRIFLHRAAARMRCGSGLAGTRRSVAGCRRRQQRRRGG
jgi:anti-sigma regulatory factor (Ser/Thr protein kinase)